MNRTVVVHNGHFLHQLLKQDPTLWASKLITISLYFDTQNTVVSSVLILPVAASAIFVPRTHTCPRSKYAYLV